MVRLRVSAGVLSQHQLNKIYEIAIKHNLDKIHLTTRQAIQLHDLSINSIVDIMEEGIKMIYSLEVVVVIILEMSDYLHYLELTLVKHLMLLHMQLLLINILSKMLLHTIYLEN